MRLNKCWVWVAQRVACEHADLFAAAASFAGAMAHKTDSTARCTPTQTVNVLLYHGTSDDTIKYNGGMIGSAPSGIYPSAEESTAMWSERNHCTNTTLPTTPYATADLIYGSGGEEKYLASW